MTDTVTYQNAVIKAKFPGAALRSFSDRLEEHVSIRDFGALGDGVTDDTAAFFKFKDYCRRVQAAAKAAGKRSPHFVLNLPYGHYRYTKGHWLRGIDSIEVNGNGSIIQIFGLTGPTAHMNVAILGNGEAYFINNDNMEILSDPPAEEEKYPGHLIDSAAEGAEEINLLTPEDADEYDVGDTIFISGLPRQVGGFLPSCGAFQWVKITGITDGAISIDRPLDHFYDKDWIDTEVADVIQFGAPRIINCTRDDFVFADLIIIRNVVFYASPDIVHGTSINLHAWHVRYENCTSDNRADIFHGFAAVSEEIDCVFPTVTESHDKLCNICRSINTTRPHFSQGTSTKILIIDSCTTYGPIRCSPMHYLELKNNTIHCGGEPAYLGYGANYSVGRLKMENNRLLDASSLIGVWTSAYLDIAAVSGTDIILEEEQCSLLAFLAIGKLLSNRVDDNRGIITNITHNGTWWALQGTWEAPSIGARWYLASLDSAELSHNFSGLGRPVPAGMLSYYSLNGEWQEITSEIIGPQNDNQFNFAGVIEGIEVDVLRAYTGEDTSAVLQIKKAGPVATILTINLKVAGHRAYTRWEAFGEQSGDSSTPSNLAGWLGGINIVNAGDSGYFSGTGDELPKYVIRIKGRVTDLQ